VATKDVEEQNDHVIANAASRANQFLGVIQKTCEDEGLGIILKPTKRSMRDATIVLRGKVPAGRGNDVELEVFADPQGKALHVGWQATRPVIGGKTLGSIGMFGEMNALARRKANNASNVRALSGALGAFNSMVYEPVVEQLIEAIRAEQGPAKNGFLGA
jgi:hypothetical protein